jgi:hypothetical protein
VKRPSLAEPIFVAAVAVLLVNDHYLKLAHPSWLTGKLSDVAGLVFFPALLAALTRRSIVATTIATAVVFALVKTWPPATDAYRYALGFLQSPLHPSPVVAVTDPTDLLALPAVLTSWWRARSSSGRARRASPARWRGSAPSSPA